jgi:hypothetical protein
MDPRFERRGFKVINFFPTLHNHKAVRPQSSNLHFVSELCLPSGGAVTAFELSGPNTFRHFSPTYYMQCLLLHPSSHSSFSVSLKCKKIYFQENHEIFEQTQSIYEGWNFNNGNTAVETPCNGTK